MRLLTCVLGLLAACTTLAEEPFAFDRTPGKLPKDVVPRHYALRLEPNIEKAEFRGSEVIDLEIRRPVKELVLHSLALGISRVQLQRGEERITLEPKIEADAQFLRLPLPSELPAGKAQLFIEFSGKLNDRPQGLFIAPYQDKGVEKRALGTQFEATDARRMFPCWDEPAFRATFQLTAIVPEKLTALSNMPVTRSQPAGDGLIEVEFANSPSMPTYLLAFCLGDFEELRDEIDGVQLRVFTTPGKIGRAKYAMEATKQILPYFHRYFGVKYPLPKLDQICFPSTGFGGMENWGLIIYNDTALLYDPATSPTSTKERVFGIVAHELAHQWFGNLVTMAWWDNLWLNEGFASWMGTKVTDHFNPDWKVWLRAAGARERAMQFDARSTTHPVQQPVLQDHQAWDVFDVITYQKGQSVLRMIEQWAGEQEFRSGLQHYFNRHAYGNTTTADLWTALEEKSGKPIGRMARGWTEQKGFPVVRVELNPKDPPREAILRQERFAVGHTPPPTDWLIPVKVQIGAESTAIHSLELDSREPARLKLPERWNSFEPVIVNPGGVGYFRVHYGDAAIAPFQMVKPGGKSVLSQLDEGDQLNLLNDTWALVQANRAQIADWLKLAEILASTDSAPVLQDIAGTLTAIDGLLVGDPLRPTFQRKAADMLRPQMERLGWDAKPGEPYLNANLRGTFIRVLGGFGEKSVLEEARVRFDRFVEDSKSLPGELRSPVIGLVGRNANPQTYAKLRELAKAQDDFEQKRLLYSALAAASDPALASQTLALSLTTELLARDAVGLVQQVAGEGEHTELAWEFARKHLEELHSKLTLHGANEFVPGIFRNFTDAKRAEELAAFAKSNLPAEASYAVSKAVDELQFRAEFRTRLRSQLPQWLGIGGQ